MSAGRLNLNYAHEAKASMDRLLEESQTDDLTKSEETGWMIHTITMALVSIAESLHRIVDEADEESLS